MVFMRYSIANFSQLETFQVSSLVFEVWNCFQHFRSMVRLTEVQRGQAIALLLEGRGQQQVAARFNVHISTIERQDRAILLAHLCNWHRTASETANNIIGDHGRHVHADTVRNRLRVHGLRARRPYVGLQLTAPRRARRRAWLAAHSPQNFPMRQWRRVLFTDESRFTLYRSDGRRRVYRRRGERYADACVIENDRFGGGSVMVWGGISHGFKSQLIVLDGTLNAARYRDEILRPVVVPLVQRYNLTFQQDNARPHVARICQNFLTAQNIQPLDWPAYSPDLSPIEHLWDELDRRDRKRQNAPTDLVQLRHALLEEWDNIPMAIVNRLMNSMHRRIRAAINARGGHTRYWKSFNSRNAICQ